MELKFPATVFKPMPEAFAEKLPLNVPPVPDAPDGPKLNAARFPVAAFNAIDVESIVPDAAIVPLDAVPKHVTKDLLISTAVIVTLPDAEARPR